MEDKRTALAIFISIVIVLIYSELYLTPYTRQATQQHATTAVERTPTPVEEVTAKSKEVIVAAPTEAQLEQAQTTVVETPLTRVTINHLGAAISSLKLLNYRDHVGSEEPLDVITRVEGQPLPGRVVSGKFSDSTLSFVRDGTGTEGAVRVGPSDNITLSFTAATEDGGTIQKSFTFSGATPYLIQVAVTRRSTDAESGRVWLEWRRFERDIAANSLSLSGFNKLGSDDRFSFAAGDSVGEEMGEIGVHRWVTIGDKYFTNAIVAEPAQAFRIGRSGHNLISQAAGAANGGTFLLYIGPKDIPTLRKVGFDLHRTVDLGWFSFLAHPMLALIRMLSHLLGNYGLAIVALTLIIKFLFLPLTKASMKSMKAMAEIQPEIKALQARVKDPTQLNQEMLALYKKKGVNPMGGCLPILIQIPVFLGLYNALLNSIEMRHAPFALWINDLSAPEGMPLFGMHIPVMVILMGVTMFIQQLKTPTNMDPTQRKVMLAMPVVFTFLFLGFPAGLTLYWLVNNIISIVQQVTLTKDSKFTPMQATVVGSIGIFLFAYLLTLASS